MFNLPEIKIGILLCIDNDTAGAMCPRLWITKESLEQSLVPREWLSCIRSHLSAPGPPIGLEAHSVSPRLLAAGYFWAALSRWGAEEESPTLKKGHMARITLVSGCAPASTIHVGRSAGGVVTNKPVGFFNIYTSTHISLETAYNWAHYSPEIWTHNLRITRLWYSSTEHFVLRPESLV